MRARAHRLYESSPALIVDVDLDRREKAVAYAAAKSLSLLLLVDPDVRRIEAARPHEGQIGGCVGDGQGDLVATDLGDIDIDVDALYDVVAQTATTSRG